LITFQAKTPVGISTAKDGRATAAGAAPTAAAPSAIPNVQVTEDGEYVRFDTTRKLAPGTAGRYKLTKGSTHDMAWGQYATNFALTAEGTCTLKLPGK